MDIRQQAGTILFDGIRALRATGNRVEVTIPPKAEKEGNPSNFENRDASLPAREKRKSFGRGRKR